jgi:CheY-like chemotaxis protein
MRPSSASAVASMARVRPPLIPATRAGLGRSGREGQLVRSERLLLVAASGARVEARLVCYGERFGPNGGSVSHQPQPLLELISRGGRLEQHLGTYQIARLAEVGERGFVPSDKPVFALPPQEVRRLLAWASGDELLGAGSVLLVGEDTLTGRMRTALSRLALHVEREEEGGRALVRVSSARPDLVIVAPGLLRSSPVEFVRALRASSAGADLAIVLVGGDKSAAFAAGANAHLADPGDSQALLARVGELLQLV